MRAQNWKGAHERYPRKPTVKSFFTAETVDLYRAVFPSDHLPENLEDLGLKRACFFAGISRSEIKDLMTRLDEAIGSLDSSMSLGRAFYRIEYTVLESIAAGYLCAVVEHNKMVKQGTKAGALLPQDIREYDFVNFVIPERVDKILQTREGASKAAAPSAALSQASVLDSGPSTGGGRGGAPGS